MEKQETKAKPFFLFSFLNAILSAVRVLAETVAAVATAAVAVGEAMCYFGGVACAAACIA